jgi:hypothetical protein
MNTLPIILATFLCLASLGSVHAAIISGYGAVADVGTYDSCAVICLRPGGLNGQIVNGSEFATSASAIIDNGTATSSGAVMFTGDVFSPALSSRSDSPAGSDNASDALVTAVQAWTYVGASSQAYSIDLSLSGSIDEPDSSADGSIEGRAAVYLYPNAGFSTNFSSFIFEEVASLGTLLDVEQLFLLPTLDLSSGVLDFVANPGDELYVWMQLETKSERGAIVDAQNTFEMAFAAGDTALLEETINPTSSPTPVPTPPILWLMGIGFAVMYAVRRHLG